MTGKDYLKFAAAAVIVKCTLMFFPIYFLAAMCPLVEKPFFTTVCILWLCVVGSLRWEHKG